MLSSLQSLARFAPTVLGKAADLFVPGSGATVTRLAEQGKKWYADKKHAAERAEILKALKITEDTLNTFDRMFILLGRDCLQLLERVDALEKQGRDSADEIVRAMVANPALQSQFDQIGGQLARLSGRVNLLEADVERLEVQCGSVGAALAEVKEKQLGDTELAFVREFCRAKRYQAAGDFAQSEPILLKLADAQPQSAAVRVALAVAKHDDPSEFRKELRRAQSLHPEDDNLHTLASAATVAVTSRQTAARPTAVPVLAHRAPAVGDTLDGWRLEGKLGGGGWGVVFRATKAGQTRAVKVMRPELAQHPTFVEAFTDEVFKLLRVRAPNVVAVERNGFCTAFQCHYFVMPLLDGMNLEEHLAKRGKPSEDVAAKWLTGLLAGLEAAHEVGLIHRDIKPQNVIIRPDGTPVLIDFGIAGVEVDGALTEALGKSRITAPPEMHSLGQADKRADLYMLAATVFYALRYDRPLKERLPYCYETAMVPEAFGLAFDAALSPNPDKRPANVAAMRELLATTRAEVARRTREAEEKRQREEAQRRKAEEAQQRKAEAERLAAERRHQQEQERKRQQRDAERRVRRERNRERVRTVARTLGPIFAVAVVLGGVGYGIYSLYFWAFAPYYAEVPSIQTGSSGELASVVFSPDGTKVASGGKEVWVWNRADGKLLDRASRTVTTTSLAFTKDGTLLAGHRDGAVGRISNGQVIPTAIESSVEYARGTFLSADGRRAARFGDKTLQAIEVASNRELCRLSADTTFGGHAAWSADGRFVAYTSGFAVVAVRDVDSNRELAKFDHGNRTSAPLVRGYVLSPDGRRVASCHEGGVHIWNVATGQQEKFLKSTFETKYALDFSPDGTRLACGGAGTITVWDINREKMLVEKIHQDVSFHCVAFSPDGSRVAFGGSDGVIRIWKQRT